MTDLQTMQYLLPVLYDHCKPDTGLTAAVSMACWALIDRPLMADAGTAGLTPSVLAQVQHY